MYETIEKIIKILVVKRESPVINFTFFNDQLNSYFESSKDQLEARNIHVRTAEEFKNLAIPVLKYMEKEGNCTITYDGSNIFSFQVHKYYRQLLMKHYKIVEERPEYPFLDLRSLGFTIDNNWLVFLNAQQDFMDEAKFADNDIGKILVITFGEEIPNIVIPPEIVNSILFDSALKKIHLYVQNQNNFVYLGRYLKKAFEKNENAVDNMLKAMQSGPPGFKDYIRKPEDFAFKFFSYLCNKVLKDLNEKKEKTAPDIAIYQSISLIRAFMTYGRTIVQKNAEKVSDMRDFGHRIKKPPYIYSARELFEIKDKSGIPYSKKYSSEFITEFINKATVLKEDEDLPEVVRVSPESKKEYYINRNMVSQIFLKTLIGGSKEIKEKYLKEWRVVLSKYKTNKEMQSDKAFIESLNDLIKGNYKLLNAFLNPDLIYLANRTFCANKGIRLSVDACFLEPGKFKTLDKLLNIDRGDLIKETKATLPLHYSIPILGRLIGFFIAILFRKSNAAEEAVFEQENETDADEEVFQEFGYSVDEDPKERRSKNSNKKQDILVSIASLKEKYLSPGKDVNETLEDLIEKWNYMVDKTARKNLIIDINSLVRDFLRSRKRFISSGKLTEKKIHILAADLVRQTSNLGIKNKDAFNKYIELYMLLMLGNIKIF